MAFLKMSNLTFKLIVMYGEIRAESLFNILISHVKSNVESFDWYLITLDVSSFDSSYIFISISLVKDK